MTKNFILPSPVEAVVAKKKKFEESSSLSHPEGSFKHQIKSCMGQISKKMEDVKKAVEEKLAALQQQQYTNKNDNFKNFDARPRFSDGNFKQRPRSTSKECWACGNVGNL
jgi:hypothetical protein